MAQQDFGVSRETGACLKKELFQSGYELAPEDATQRGDGRMKSAGRCRSESAMTMFPVENTFTANPFASRWCRTRRENVRIVFDDKDAWSHGGIVSAGQAEHPVHLPERLDG